MTTNAARFRLAAGKDKMLLEFGLRRAQGPNGAISGSCYSYMGGFDATSNVLAGKLFGMAVKGTHAHSFVTSFTSLDDVGSKPIQDAQGKECNLKQLCLDVRGELTGKYGGIYAGTNDSELAAFIDYAQAYPNGFLALIDTYDVLYRQPTNQPSSPSAYDDDASCRVCVCVCVCVCVYTLSFMSNSPYVLSCFALAVVLGTT